jgi:hypothetical protein
MLVAAGHPLISLRLQADAAPVLDPDGVARMLASSHPRINTDHNRWIEYVTPHYQASSYDWLSRNLQFLRRYR